MLEQTLGKIEKFDHPNIAKIHTWFREDKSIYIISESVEGGELLDRLISVK